MFAQCVFSCVARANACVWRLAFSVACGVRVGRNVRGVVGSERAEGAGGVTYLRPALLGRGVRGFRRADVRTSEFTGGLGGNLETYKERVFAGEISQAVWTAGAAYASR